MFSDKFAKFIEMWQKDFAIERTIDEKICVDKDGNPLPWYTYPAIEYLLQLDYRQKRVFEFGCGNSSLFWAIRAKNVISIEDNPQWFAKWQREFKVENLDIRYRGGGDDYYKAIAEENGFFDIIAIDGKYRAQCAEAAVGKLAPGGMIILDDSDRVATSDEYVMAVEILRQADLLQVDFHGFCPMNCYSKTTSLFLHRNFDFKPLYPHQPSEGWGNLWSLGRKKRKEFYKKFGK